MLILKTKFPKLHIISRSVIHIMFSLSYGHAQGASLDLRVVLTLMECGHFIQKK